MDTAPGPGTAFHYPEPEGRWVPNPQDVLRQWYPVKTTADKLAGVFQQVADNDGRVELVHHVGGRDYLVCYSRPVLR